jgi:phage FluMu gp28-like protein
MVATAQPIARKPRAGTPSPLDILLLYQRKWVDDGARFKIGLWARQTGKSLSCAGEAVRDCFTRPLSQWVILSAGERQALEFMEKAKQWAEAFRLAIEEFTIDRDGAEALIKSAEIRFPRNSRMLALPANPATARGYSANLILDEFAFHDDSAAIWRAIYPSISNPLSGEKKLRVVSTPNGRGNKFYDLWTKNTNYSHHKISIHDAEAAGLPVNIDELKAALDDPEGWAQEYECEFIDAGGVLLSYELIQACEHEQAAIEEKGPATGAPRFVGIDVGTVDDPTVCLTLERRSDGNLWTVECLVLRKMDLTPQMEILRPRLRAAAAAKIDASGLGTQMAQDFEREFGGKVEGAKFTPALKRRIFPRLKKLFQDRGIRIPVSRDFREDCHAYQESFSGGEANYWAPRTKEGHSDRCTALALAADAAADEGPEMGIY